MKLPQRLYGGVRLLDRPSLANVSRLDHLSMPMIHLMHKHGILLDTAALKEQEVRLNGKLRRLDHEIGLWVERPGFNPGSPDQVADYLFNDLKLEVPGGTKLTPTAKRAVVDDDVLAAINHLHPVVPLIRERRATSKLLGTYVCALPLLVQPDRRLHTTFRTTVARTGRLSSEDPNLQNIPIRTDEGRLVRKAFIAQPGCVLASADYSQIEMVMAAHLSGDPVMMDIFHRGLDIHIKTACEIFHRDYDAVMKLWKPFKNGELVIGSGPWQEMEDFKNSERLPAKQMGFGILYGETPPGLQAQILAEGGPFWEVAACQDMIERWYGVYEGVRAWVELQYQRVRRYGMTWDCFGRPRLIPEVRSALSGMVNAGLRQAGNHPLQAGAQGIIKLAMAILMPLVEMFESYAGAVCRPLLQIHDELIFELSRDIAQDFCAMSQPLMEQAVPLSVPVRVSTATADNWMELK